MCGNEKETAVDSGEDGAIDGLLRETMTLWPAPSAFSPAFADSVVGNIERRKKITFRLRAIILSVYWALAIAGSAWLLMRLGLPGWVDDLFPVLIPVGLAIIFWPGRALALAARFLRLMLS